MWWTLVLSSNLLGAIAFANEDLILSELRKGNYVSIASDLVWIVAGLLLIHVVGAVTRTQDRDPVAPSSSPPPLIR